jgi:manganese/iron transport system substrate-binding protein
MAVAIAVVFAFCITTFPSTSFAQETSRRKVVVCSTTQSADFTKQIVGDRWEVVCVLSAAEDPHTYDITPADIDQIKRADLCVQNGWNLEGHDWMGTQARNQGKPLVTCVTGVKPLMVEHEASDNEADVEAVKDPHAWFDINNAMIYVTNIRNAICDLDPEHAGEYNARAKLYLLQLRVLKQWVAAQVNAIPKERRILVTHHDAFGYFAKANGFRAESPVGWTTGELTGISIGQRQQVVEQIRNLGVKSIFVETSTETATLKSIAEETGIKIGGSLYSDAMGASGTAGETYIGMIRENVLTIVNSLK